jgi:hypothetical protein
MSNSVRKSIRLAFLTVATITLFANGALATVSWGGNGFTYWSEPGDCAGNGQGFHNLCESYCQSTWGYDSQCWEYSCAQWGECIQGYCECFD